MKFIPPNPILSTQTLCYVILCYVMLCYVTLDTRQADNDISNVTNKYVNLK